MSILWIIINELMILLRAYERSVLCVLCCVLYGVEFVFCVVVLSALSVMCVRVLCMLCVYVVCLCVKFIFIGDIHIIYKYLMIFYQTGFDTV